MSTLIADGLVVLLVLSGFLLLLAVPIALGTFVAEHWPWRRR